MKHWEPKDYVDSQKKQIAEIQKSSNTFQKALHGMLLVSTCVMIAMGAYIVMDDKIDEKTREQASLVTLVMMVSGFLSLSSFVTNLTKIRSGDAIAKMPFEEIVEKCPRPLGSNGSKVAVEDMFIGGSGSPNAVEGVTVAEETIHAKYVINCAGGASDRIARLVGDDSFKIKPRLGDYLLLNRNQVRI